MKRQSSKPIDSKTVRQWAMMGRIPLEGAQPSYIWDKYRTVVRVYYFENDTRQMTEDEQFLFLADKKAFVQRYVDMFDYWDDVWVNK